MARERVLERRLLGVVAVWALLLVVNNALPYVGLRDDSCQTMFSGLDWTSTTNNHFFVPQHALSDIWASWETRGVAIAPWPTERSLVYEAEWLADESRTHNTEATRAVIDRLCRAGHRVAIEVRRVDDRGGPWARHEDACSVAVLAQPHRWIPVRLFDTDSRPFEAP